MPVCVCVVQHLAADKTYNNLDITVKKALEHRNQSERVIKCTMNDTLHQILEKIVQSEVWLSLPLHVLLMSCLIDDLELLIWKQVHRIVVVDSDDHVIGIISLSDILSFLVLRPVGLERKDIDCNKLVEETAEEANSDTNEDTTDD